MDEMTFRCAQPVDLTGIKEIIKATFAPAAQYPDVVDDMENEAWFGAENWVVAERDSHLISALGLRGGFMWMSGVPVPTSTVGTVCTLPEERGKGIGGGLMRYADSISRERGDVLTRLHTSFARYAFYGRVGYVKALNERPCGVFEVDRISSHATQDAERRLGRGVIRRAARQDAARLLEIYEATYSRVSGCVSRNELFMRRRIQGKRKFWSWSAPAFAVVDDPKDGVVAYVAYELSDEKQHIGELAAMDGHAWTCRALLVHVAHEGQTRGFTHVTTGLDVHSPHFFVLRDFPITGPEDSTIIFLKVQDERKLIDLICPVIAKRAVHHEVKLTMHLAGTGEVTIGDGQEVEIVTDVPHLATLFYNGAWLSGLLGQGDLQMRPDTMRVHNALRQVFPDTHAIRCELDGY